jgi:hypothetical protein
MLLSTRRLYVVAAFALSPFLAFPWDVQAADSAPPQPNQVLPQQPQGTAHQGVMAPPSTGDSAINKGTPSAQHFPTPVIHPSPTSKPRSTAPQKE